MGPALVLVLAAILSAQAPTVAPGPRTLHVSAEGSDAWTGALAQPNAGRTDGPVATVGTALQRLRAYRAATGDRAQAEIIVQPGIYYMAARLMLGPEESFLTIRGGGKDATTLSGGRVIGGWKPAGGGLWSAEIPEVKAGRWRFRQLFVNGQRRTPARTPNTGWFEVARSVPPGTTPDGQPGTEDRTAFRYGEGDIRAWPDLEDISAVVFHSWEVARLPIASVDEATRTVRFAGPSFWAFGYWGAGQRYYIENAPGSLDSPGEWQLDRRTGVVTYFPMPGEDMTTATVVVPALTELARLAGEGALGLPVEEIRFVGLSFQHQDWTLEPQGHSDPQAAVTVPAAIMADAAVRCSFENCEIAHVGGYALWFRRACVGNTIADSRIRDFGTGGVRIGEANPATDDADESKGNAVRNCHIYDGGHVYPSGVGVWIAQSSGNTVSHNEIHGLPYTGISIGWNWGDEANRTRANVVESNHVHHVLSGILNDGGAIYTLGVSPGSAIRHNLFHDIWPYHVIGWGIYLDATTAGYTVEDNVVYNTFSGGLMYNNGGHGNAIRNNVFALSSQQALWPCWPSDADTFERNIVYATQGDLVWPHAQRSLTAAMEARRPLDGWRRNVYWLAGREATFLTRPLAEWQALGLDAGSIVADPGFVDAAGYDFRLRPDSPALALGIRSIDTSDTGLTGDPAWVAEPRAIRYPTTVIPPVAGALGPVPVDDGFEQDVVGARPRGARVSGERSGASIGVTDAQAAEGAHSVKVTDSASLEPAYEPHFFYEPHYTEGKLTQSFDALLPPGSLMFTEWRDVTVYPDCIGPSVTFSGDGTVTVGGGVVARFAPGEWLHVDIECELRPDGPIRYDLTVTPRGGPAQRVAGLPVAGKAFRAAHWLGFVSTAQADVSYYLDNLKLGP